MVKLVSSLQMAETSCTVPEKALCKFAHLLPGRDSDRHSIDRHGEWSDAQFFSDGATDRKFRLRRSAGLDRGNDTDVCKTDEATHSIGLRASSFGLC